MPGTWVRFTGIDQHWPADLANGSLRIGDLGVIIGEYLGMRPLYPVPMYRVRFAHLSSGIHLFCTEFEPTD
jgi:hypothetical protein